LRNHGAADAVLTEKREASRTKFKRILLSALVLTMALAILAGCGSKPTDDTKDSTVDCYDFSIYGGEGGVQYTGETEVIEGKPCMVFALGTDRDDQFVRERYYAVCDNLVYSYDAEGDA
jgi:predicted small lipoprotein YifL